jgi:hypothetical protein
MGKKEIVLRTCNLQIGVMRQQGTNASHIAQWNHLIRSACYYDNLALAWAKTSVMPTLVTEGTARKHGGKRLGIPWCTCLGDEPRSHMFGSDSGVPALASTLKCATANPAHEQATDYWQCNGSCPTGARCKVQQRRNKYQPLNSRRALISKRRRDGRPERVPKDRKRACGANAIENLQRLPEKEGEVVSDRRTIGEAVPEKIEAHDPQLCRPQVWNKPVEFPVWDSCAMHQQYRRITLLAVVYQMSQSCAERQVASTGRASQIIKRRLRHALHWFASSPVSVRHFRH